MVVYKAMGEPSYTPKPPPSTRTFITPPDIGVGEAMNCNACGFDMGDSLGDTGRCAGCGTPLGPAKDHDKPAPGFEVPTTQYRQTYDEEGHYKDTVDVEIDTHIVTDEDVEAYPVLRGARVVKSCDFEWFAGIGAEPCHGYFLKQRTLVVDLTDFDPDWNHKYDDEADREPVGACPDCGCETGEHSYASDGHAGSEALTCVSCGHEFYDEFWA